MARLSSDTDHWSASRSLHEWLESEGIPGISGIDTRALTKRLRNKGTMLGKLVPDGKDIDWRDPGDENLVSQVSIGEPITYGTDGPRVLLVDTGVKANIIRSLVRHGSRVTRVPWDHDLTTVDFDGVFLANGPGDPTQATRTVDNIRKLLGERVPIFGICLGNQLLALAAGARTYKLKFGHRSQNQPASELGSPRCYVTSQNHGYAVDASQLPDGWREWFVNANDGSNEGIRHEWKPFSSVQFHPEATPGPTDTAWLFERFVETLK